MSERRNTLSKRERLSWKRYIDQLFIKGHSFVAFPLRVVFLLLDNNEQDSLSRSSILVSVSKKKFKRAVKRNRVKRLIREAYRIHKHELIETLNSKNKVLFVAFIYMDAELHSFEHIEKSMNKAMQLLKEKLEP